MISDEIERNKWTARRLRDCLSLVDRAKDEEDSILSIRIGSLGDRYLRRDGRFHGYSEMPVGKVHAEVISGNLLAIAELDENNFEGALAVSDALKELDHVLRSLIEHVSIDRDSGFLEGFIEYANKEIDDRRGNPRAFLQSPYRESFNDSPASLVGVGCGSPHRTSQDTAR